MTDFWLNNPKVLLSDFCNFNPFTTGNLNDKLNAYTRFIIIVILVIFCITKEVKYLIIGVIFIILIIIAYIKYSKDKFEIQKPLRESDYFNTEKIINNPLKNVPITDYDKEQKFSKASDSGDMNKFINGKMFQTSSDYIFDKNTRQYYTTSNTSVPNEQGEFASWLYSTENNCKSGSINAFRPGQTIENQNCTGFDVSVPTNFGKL